MTISVCMGTYNGGKYIEKQLYSILHQSHKPDEVIICDDGSKDDTVAVVRTFIEHNQLQDKWKVYVNDLNKGYPDNYYYAMSLCSGEIVFLADQDDIWNERKLERMSSVLSEQKNVQVLACKFGLIDAEGENIHSVMAPTHNRGTGGLRKVSVHDVFYKYEWPGMVMAYRREWYRKWFCSYYKIPHDLLISAKAAEEGLFFQLDEELACHRRHDNNVAKEEHRIRKLLNKNRKLEEIENFIGYLDEFAEKKVLQTTEGHKILEQKQKAMHARYDALWSGKISKVIKSAREYKENVRMATVICDVLICKQHQKELK